jgi:LDH2 family malate/lactate/ureidoglycolate dehydrogenase
VLVPGEPEAEAAARADVAGIVIDRVHAANLAALGARLGVPFPA